MAGKGARLCRAWGWVLGCLWLGLPLENHAAPGQEIGQRQADLDEVKNRLREIEKAITATEGNRSAAAEALATVEKAYSEAARKARGLADHRQQVEQSLTDLEAGQRTLDGRIAARQKELSAWLRHYYTHDQGTWMARLLNGNDPNQLARNAYYMERAGAANWRVVEGLREDLADKRRLAEAVREQQAELARLESEQRQESERFERLQQERKVALAQVSAQLTSQRQAADELKRDEARLGQLIARLQRIAQEQAARAAAKAAAEAQARRRAEAVARQAAAAGSGARPSPRGGGEAQEEAVVGRADPVAENPGVPSPTGVSFAQLQGRLPAPVRGDVVGRFGAPRAGGGATWKGIFIRARAGMEVRAVAAGEVVFSDWLRGFGNLIILDHGGDYLTIYGNNDALLRTNGQRVAGGEALASVGASGGTGESGLYFEIRRQGQALDPSRWIRLQ